MYKYNFNLTYYFLINRKKLSCYTLYNDGILTSYAILS